MKSEKTKTASSVTPALGTRSGILTAKQKEAQRESWTDQLQCEAKKLMTIDEQVQMGVIPPPGFIGTFEPMEVYDAAELVKQRGAENKAE